MQIALRPTMAMCGFSSRRVYLVGEDAYLEREHPIVCAIASEGYVHTLGDGGTVRRRGRSGFTRTPGQKMPFPFPVATITKLTARFADLFRLRSGSAFYGTLVVSLRRNGVAFYWVPCKLRTAPRASIDRLWSVGGSVAINSRLPGPTRPKSPPIFSRSCARFRPVIQRTLGDLRSRDRRLRRYRSCSCRAAGPAWYPSPGVD